MEHDILIYPRPVILEMRKELEAVQKHECVATYKGECDLLGVLALGDDLGESLSRFQENVSLGGGGEADECKDKTVDRKHEDDGNTYLARRGRLK